MALHRYLLMLPPLMLAVTALPVHAQAPPKSGGEEFERAEGFPFGVFQMRQPPSVWCLPPFFMSADRVIFDTPNARIIAVGNVALYFNDYILTSDQVIYDRTTNKLIAEPNVQLKEPNGTIIRADRLEPANDLRDAFVASMRHDKMAPGGCQSGTEQLPR